MCFAPRMQAGDSAPHRAGSRLGERLEANPRELAARWGKLLPPSAPSSSTTYVCTRVWWGWRLGLASQSLSGRGWLIGADNKPETQYWHLQWPRCLCLWRAGLVFIPALPEDHLGNPKERKATCSPYCCTGKWRRLGSDPPLLGGKLSGPLHGR